MVSMAGRVAVVTGASRGIGRAIALGLARAGCHIVVAAKSTESTERLPGSIFTVAEEVRALGVEALPVQTDVRDEGQIEQLGKQVLERFGRVDVLVNNAGALWWKSLLETPAKRFDLVLGVNIALAGNRALDFLASSYSSKLNEGPYSGSKYSGYLLRASYLYRFR